MEGDQTWKVEILFDPDGALIAFPQIAVTTDSNILDHTARWTNLWDALAPSLPSAPWLIDLNTEQILPSLLHAAWPEKETIP